MLPCENVTFKSDYCRTYLKMSQENRTRCLQSELKVRTVLKTIAFGLHLRKFYLKICLCFRYAFRCSRHFFYIETMNRQGMSKAKKTFGISIVIELRTVFLVINIGVKLQL